MAETNQLYSRLLGSRYGLNGHIELNTDLDSLTPEIEISFYVAAQSNLVEPVVSEVITVIIGCFDITLIEGEYDPLNIIN